MTTSNEMRALTVDELKRRAAELRESMFNLRIKHKTGTLESPVELPKNRKELARVLTVLGEKERSQKVAK